MRAATIDHGRVRPAGLSVGTAAFVGAWIVGLAIARLTGAAAVLLLLAAAVIAAAAAAGGAWWSTRRLALGDVAVPALTRVDVATDVTIAVSGQHVARLTGGVRFFADARRTQLLATVALADLDAAGCGRTTVRFASPGVVDRLFADVASAGIAGWTWFAKPVTIDIEPLHVAPRPAGPPLPIETRPTLHDGSSVSRRGPRHGEIDGVRPWREGDGEGAVHWPSSLRARSLIVHDRNAASDHEWTIDIRPDQPDAVTAARLAHTLLEGLGHGHHVNVRTADDDTATTRVLTTDDALRLAARQAGPLRQPEPPPRPLWRRRLTVVAPHDEALASSESVTPAARSATAVASFIGIAMLLQALAAGPLTVGAAALGIVLGALATELLEQRGTPRPRWLKFGIGVGTVGSLAYVAQGLGGVTGLLAALRGPMPDLLILLVVLHGFEVADRRTARVHQAIGAVVVAYATGLRIDDAVGWWMGAWGLVAVVAVRTTTRSERGPLESAWRRVGRRNARVAIATAQVGASLLVAAAATLALLSVVPVPDGPARLGLPALANDAPRVPNRGGLAGPDGGPPVPNDGTRGALGQVGGYPGFSETLDTSVRGDLGDEIVLRVRAPEPAFWRGQTFADFDGRTWSVDDDDGRPQRGPRIDVPRTLGDGPRPGSGVDVEQFVQTYYVEADLPNVVFAAARPSVVTFDGSLWARPDGALRSDVTLTEGSVYTVVSARPQVTQATLRAQGDVAAFFASAPPDVEHLIRPFLELPASTTSRTADLAAALQPPGGSTYDTILAYQRWLGDNTEYDLDAPVPARGADAVDDFLFESQRGFCEQIASSLAIMLRSRGVPARIATGYLPGERDRVSGVFEVRASDAHAWVEVWFPETGWESFDPTASVPLAGDVDQGSVGGDLIAAALASITSHPGELALAAIAIAGVLAAIRLVAALAHRRRRGRWGILQDRFSALSADAAATNPSIARTFADTQVGRDAEALARDLDRAAFDPTWADPPDGYDAARERLRRLERV